MRGDSGFFVGRQGNISPPPLGMAKVPTRVVPTGPSNQDAPHIGNQFEEDSFFQRVLQRLLPPAAWNPIAGDLVRTDC